MQKYSSGKMLTGEVKNILVDVLADRVEAHQRARAAVTDEMVSAFMTERRLIF
jgi:tryptophanyl-tRNA synthetase